MSIKYDIWASSGTVSVHLFCPWVGHAYIFLCMPCDFLLLQTGHHKNQIILFYLWKSDSPHLLVFAVCCVSAGDQPEGKVYGFLTSVLSLHLSLATYGGFLNSLACVVVFECPEVRSWGGCPLTHAAPFNATKTSSASGGWNNGGQPLCLHLSNQKQQPLHKSLISGQGPHYSLQLQQGAPGMCAWLSVMGL